MNLDERNDFYDEKAQEIINILLKKGQPISFVEAVGIIEHVRLNLTNAFFKIINEDG